MLRHSLPANQRATSAKYRTLIGILGMAVGMCGVIGTMAVFMMAHDTTQKKIPSQSLPQWEIFGVNIEQDGTTIPPPESCKTVALLYNLGGRSTQMLSIQTQGPLTVSGCGGCIGIRLKPGLSCKVRTAPTAIKNGPFEGILKINGFQGRTPILQVGGIAYNIESEETDQK